MQKLNARYFIRKFEAIPTNRWTVNRFNVHNRSCALGHCGMSDNNADTPESKALQILFREVGLTVTGVNDSNQGGLPTMLPISSNDKTYSTDLGDTPKERIINALVLIETGLLKETLE